MAPTAATSIFADRTALVYAPSMTLTTPDGFTYRNHTRTSMRCPIDLRSGSDGSFEHPVHLMPAESVTVPGGFELRNNHSIPVANPARQLVATSAPTTDDSRPQSTPGSVKAPRRIRAFLPGRPEDRTLFVSNLEYSTTHDDLQQLFGGKPNGVERAMLVTKFTKFQGKAAIDFSTHDAAQEAGKRLHGLRHEVSGRPMLISWVWRKQWGERITFFDEDEPESQPERQRLSMSVLTEAMMDEIIQHGRLTHEEFNHLSMEYMASSGAAMGQEEQSGGMGTGHQEPAYPRARSTSVSDAGTDENVPLASCGMARDPNNIDE